MLQALRLPLVSLSDLGSNKKQKANRHVSLGANNSACGFALLAGCADALMDHDGSAKDGYAAMRLCALS